MKCECGHSMECFVSHSSRCWRFKLEKEAIDMHQTGPSYVIVVSGYKGNQDQFMMLDGFRIIYLDKDVATKKAESLAASENFRDCKVYVASLRTVSQSVKPVVTTNLL